MTVQLSPLPKLRFVDSSGNALSGGLLFTYAAGTTTKQNTYTDSTGNTANANPIVLDSRGECNCWLTAGTAYKFVLSPSTDTDPPTNAIWTVDNANAGTIASLGANTFTGTQTLSPSGGTQAIVITAGAINETSSTMASAASVNIGAAPANYLKITGTTTITAFDTVQAGTRRIVEFGGALTLTHDATKLILPGATNITTAAGDVAIFVSEGSGNWRCAGYMPANGQLLAAGLTALLASNAQALGGTDTTHAVTSAGLASSKTLAITGHMKLPGGIILNWGQVTFSTSSAQTVTFDLAFSNNIYSGSAIPNTNAGNCWISATSTSQMTITFSTAVSATVYWIAVGS